MMMIIGNEWWVLFLWFFPQIFLHELGHFVGYRVFGIRPKLHFKWWGIQIGEHKDLFKLKPFQFGLVGWMGVMSGLVYTIAFGEIFLLIYLLMCSIDLMNMYYVLKARKFKGTMGDYLIDLYNIESNKLRDARLER